jgi:hypothetical protein
MNRSILIVICDFLLVSLLAFGTVDVKKLGQTGTPQIKQAASSTNEVTPRQDLGDVMRLALDEERKNREQLVGELTKTRELVDQQNQQIQNVRGQLETREQQAARLEAERASLQNKFAAAQTNLASLNEQLQATTAETALTKEQRAAMEAEAHRQAERARALEQQLAQVQKSNELLQSDQRILQNQLLMSETSNHMAVAQMTQLQDEVMSQRQQNTRLAENVKVLAAKSTELATEIRENRPLTPNMIFDDYSTNRVTADFTGVKSGIFGIETSKGRESHLVLVTDGTNTFALGHVQDTPLTLATPGAQWQELGGTLTHDSASFPVQSLSFYFTDPRLIFIPVPADQAQALGCKIYHFAKDPYTFQDAVVIGTREDYYGESKFQIDTTTPNYLKMDHNSLKGMFGKFNPSSGDLVLSKSGELLGVMANNSYCAVIRNFVPMSTLRFGTSGRNQQTSQILSSLYTVVFDMPFKLQ